MLKEILLGLGVIGLIVLIIVIALLPLICTIILGTYIATNILGLTGIVWWSFIIIFYIIIMGLIGMIA